MNLKTMAVAGCSVFVLGIGANVMAQWNTQPFGSGYIHYGPGGSTITSSRFGSGWIHYGPGGRTSTTMPFGNGWITRGGSWTTSRFGSGYIHNYSGGGSFTSMPFGGGWIHSGPGMRTTTTMPFGNGWITRGQSAAELFEDKDFYDKVDVTLFADALQVRDVSVLMGFAWDLKGAEIILGKVDKKTSSAMVFASAAKLAAEQGNSDALKAIVALAPECKKYEDQLSLKGKTRGMNNSVTAVPQLTVLPKNALEKALKELRPWEQPLFDRYICASFRGMPISSAVNATTLVNDGRITMNPLMIALGSMELAKYPYDKKLGIKFEPAQIFAEAAELAILKQDKEALAQIIALYGTASFKTADYAKYLQNELALMSSTRGLSGKSKDAEPSLMDFTKTIWTVYYDVPDMQQVK